MQQQSISIGTLVEQFKKGELRLPEIQRQYVWKAPRVRDLLDSLYRGYPSGSILLWETDDLVPTRPGAIEQDKGLVRPKLLLDGQQRLTSLTAVLGGELIKVRGQSKPIDILFNLDHPDTLDEATEVEGDMENPLVDEDDAVSSLEDDEATQPMERLNRRTFVVSNKVLAAAPNWVSVTKVFAGLSDADIMERVGVESFKDLRYKKYTERLAKLRKIEDYAYIVHVLGRELSYAEVTEIFVRVNSLGAKLRSSDLALAQMTSRWPNLLGELETFQEECERSWFTLDLGLLIRAIVIFATGQCLFKSVGTLPQAKMEEGWRKAKDGLNFAINFLRNNAGVEDESLLGSPFFVLSLAALGVAKDNRFTDAETRALLRWLYLAHAKGRYSRGSTETLLNEDLALIFRHANPIEEMLGVLERQAGRLDITAQDFAKRGVNSPLFSLAFLALKDAGAKDWESNIALSLRHQGKLHYIEFHHIFPKALLKKHTARFETQEINEIANLAFISGRSNRRISAKNPAEYLGDIEPARLAAQCIPAPGELRQLDNFRDFLTYRRAALADAVNAFIRKKTEGSSNCT